VTSANDKVEFVVEFGEPILYWRDACPTCGEKHNTVEPGETPTCKTCRTVLGDPIPSDYWSPSS
jgi:hypothetical protein